MRPVYRPRIYPRVARTRLKICVTGDRGVGKTSLITQYLHYDLDGRYFPTVGPRVYGKRVGVRLSDYNLTVLAELELWDSAGDHGLGTVLRHAYYHGADGIVAVCDTARQETLRHIDFWLDSAKDVVRGPKVVLAVNKADLPKRRVHPRSVQVTAQAHNAPYMFVSALSGDNVDNLFAGLVIDVIRRKVGRRPYLPAPTLA